jgi:hypothetical protein
MELKALRVELGREYRKVHGSNSDRLTFSGFVEEEAQLEMLQENGGEVSTKAVNEVIFPENGEMGLLE